MTTNQEAKNYLKKRLKAEHSMDDNLEDILDYAVKELNRIVAKYHISVGELENSTNPNVQREVNTLIQRIIDELYDDVQLLSIEANKNDSSNILLYIGMAIAGMTLYSRITKWVRSFITETQAKYDEGYILSRYKPNINKASAYGLKRLLDQTIAMAWMYELKQMASSQGAKYFKSHRGSSYPCEICDDYVALGLQPIENYSLPLHPNCCCYATFYDSLQQPININTTEYA